MTNHNICERFASCSRFSKLGLCKIETGAVDKQIVARFLEFLSSCLPEASSIGETEKIEEVAQSSVRWERNRYKGVFPFYMESLTVVESLNDNRINAELPLTLGFPGQWFVAKDVFERSSADYFENWAGEWRSWIESVAQAGTFSGGLAYNVLEIPANELRKGSVDIRPLTLHAIAKDGRAVDRGDVAGQSAIANAFWQTFWATGATRAERGHTFPVAFFPVDRSSEFEFKEPFHERYVSLRRRLFGRSAIVGYVLEVLTAHRALLFSPDNCLFGISAGFDPVNAEVSSADVLLAVDELNRTGFVDAYTGTNAKAFSFWKTHEEDLGEGAPWPYSDPALNNKIKASGHGQTDSLDRVRANATGWVAIHRVVPYAGCAYLYQVMSESDQLKQRGKIQDLDGDLIAATNSTFFLNFPEEYSALHSAMNEPVSLLVENGETRQIRTLRRAAFVLTNSGEAFITDRIGNKLNSDALVFEGESSSVTYYDKADRSFKENTFGPLFFGAAVVGNSIVETFEEISTEVPPAGWLIGDSEAFGGRIQPENAAEAMIRQEGNLEPVDVRHAFAIGPMLIKNGEIVELGESQEEFSSLKMSGQLAFEETSELTRTQLPEALLNCEARGVPPTRFPYDWDATRAPRSAIGVKANGNVVVVVLDGRADLKHSVGATLKDLAAVMQSIGCTDAMNMDGGGSSVMFVNEPELYNNKLRQDLRDGVVNLPSDMGGVERLLPVPLVIYKRK